LIKSIQVKLKMFRSSKILEKEKLLTFLIEKEITKISFGKLLFVPNS